MFIQTSLWSHPTDKTWLSLWDKCSSTQQLWLRLGRVLCLRRTVQVHVWGSAAGLRRGRCSPRASGRWYSLWSRCWQPGLTVCLWPAAMHSATQRDRGLAQCGAHLTTIPHLTPAALPKTHRAVAIALPRASPGWCSVVLCEEHVTLQARALLCFVLEAQIFPVTVWCQNIERLALIYSECMKYQAVLLLFKGRWIQLKPVSHDELESTESIKDSCREADKLKGF